MNSSSSTGASYDSGSILVGLWRLVANSHVACSLSQCAEAHSATIPIARVGLQGVHGNRFTRGHPTRADQAPINANHTKAPRASVTYSITLSTSIIQVGYA